MELPGPNVWVLGRHFTWRPEPERFVRRPLVDLQEAAEDLVRHFGRMA